MLRIRPLSPRAKMPTNRAKIAAGHDLYAMANIHIPARGQVLVETGLAIGLPKGTYSRIAQTQWTGNEKDNKCWSRCYRPGQYRRSQGHPYQPGK